MQTIKDLISIAAFLVGTYQAMCILDGAALLNPDSGPLKFELRFMPPSAPAKDIASTPIEKQSSPPIHRAIVTPIASEPKDRSK